MQRIFCNVVIDFNMAIFTVICKCPPLVKQVLNCFGRKLDHPLAESPPRETGRCPDCWARMTCVRARLMRSLESARNNYINITSAESGTTTRESSLNLVEASNRVQKTGRLASFFSASLVTTEPAILSPSLI